MDGPIEKFRLREPSDRFIQIEEAARMIGVSVRQLYGRKGKLRGLRCVRLGRRVVFSLREVEWFITMREQESERTACHEQKEAADG